VGRLVFGATDEKAGGVRSHFGIGTDAQLNHRFAWSSGLLEQAAVERLQSFFRARRAEGRK
jgi:tRNA(adenine34) deaminase